MKQQLPTHSLRIVSQLVVLGTLATSLAAAQTYTRQFQLAGSATYPEKTSTGFTQGYSDGEIDVTANGLSLSYQNLTTGTLPEWTTITNIADITGGGIQTNRYLSFTVGPDNFNGLAGYTGSYSVEITRIYNSVASVDLNEFFEIRTSLDNFGTPLVTWGGVQTDGSVFRAPGLTVGPPPFINTNGNVITTDTPLEIRLYSWYANPGGDGTIGADDSNSTGFRFDYTVTAVPEPSAVFLLGAAGGLVFLRRRRA